MQVLAGRYRLVELIGSGGTGSVWRAHDEVLGRSVAVKVLTSDLAKRPEMRQRIRDEARAAARLAHPNISVVHDFGEWVDADGAVMPYVVMELIDGPSLHDLLAHGPLPWSRAAAIGAQVASGLAAAHARGLVHRDVKPANVVVAPTGAKLVDFGISAIAGGLPDDGALIGTPGYMAPERLAGGPTTPASDVYGLGLLLQQSIAPSSVEDSPPASLTTLCDQCLAADPAERPEAAEAARVLNEALGLSAAVPAFGNGLAVLPSVRSAPTPTRLADDWATVLNGRRPSHWLRPVLIGGAILFVVLGGLAAGAALRGLRKPATTVGAPPVAACQAIYRVHSDDGQRFSGDLTVVNTGAAALQNWTLSFRYLGDQTANGPGFRQQGDAVSVGPVRNTLVAGQKVTYQFEGRYDEANPMPGSFTIGGTACTTELVGPVTTQPTRNKEGHGGGDGHDGGGGGSGEGDRRRG
jgi:eukaryotic-like serine/threonine-protein kinase